MKRSTVDEDARNRRETGSRKLVADEAAVDRDKVGLDAAENVSHGLTEEVDEVPERTRKSDGRDQASRNASRDVDTHPWPPESERQ